MIPSQTGVTFTVSRWLFVRLLGAIYLIAFSSLGVQILGLVGEQGILPARDFLDRAWAAWGTKALFQLPSLFWISTSDQALVGACWAGAALSGLLILGFVPPVSLLLLWGLYLSLSVVSQIFLGFQWDVLLLETGLIAVFYSRWAKWDSFPETDFLPDPQETDPADSRDVAANALTGGWTSSEVLMRWMLYLLLFKLMFLSGITKILSGDETWAAWTALEYHYETQPLPPWPAWYMHQLPAWAHRISLAFMWLAELVVPFAFLGPTSWRRIRLGAAAVTIFFQLGLIATGNYTFFNWLTIVLCVPLIDDRAWRSLAGAWLRLGSSIRGEVEGVLSLKLFLCRGFMVLTLPLSILVFVEEMARTADWVEIRNWLRSADPVTGMIEPFRSINGYGLFRVMTTQRPEIVVEVSGDGETWLEYPFRWKVGDVARRPRFVAPHQPRLDWQMWFAALNPRGNEAWLHSLMKRLLDGSPRVAALLDESPVGPDPPRYVRLAYFDYRFTRTGQNPSTDWWIRRRLGELTPAVSLDSFALVRP